MGRYGAAKTSRPGTGRRPKGDARVGHTGRHHGPPSKGVYGAALRLFDLHVGAARPAPSDMHVPWLAADLTVLDVVLHAPAAHVQAEVRRSPTVGTQHSNRILRRSIVVLVVDAHCVRTADTGDADVVALADVTGSGVCIGERLSAAGDCIGA
jgi:hypothetical protein